MKVINIDNFDRDCIPDKLVCENCNEYYANRIAELLNETTDPNGEDYFVVKHDDYKLKKSYE